MSSVEVSLIASNHKLEPDGERRILRPKRPPPPPPPPSQPKPPNPRIEQTIIPPEIEISPPSAETSTEPVDDLEQNHPTLLLEFKRLFDNFDYESIREEILTRKMIECNFTTVLWRIFLHCLPRDSNQWDEILDTTRNNYKKLIEQYTIDPYKISSDDNNDTKHLNHPLSRDENSLWAQHFADAELKATITIDVRRTWPDISFFRNPRMIDLQLRILFTHNRHHQKTTPYRQGMHEILGIIVYSIHLEYLKINEYQDSNELMKKIYDLQYLEHDAYAIFEKIMDHLRQFYALTTNNSGIRKCFSMHDTKQIPFQRLNDGHIPTNDTAIRMNSIFESLKHHDKVLHCRLEELKIEPTVYGTRWLRVLFGREIPFESIPNLWTVIFCFDESFGFVDYFFIALLIKVGQIIRKQGEIENSHFLQSLMKHNVVTNVEPVIRKALILSGRQLPPLIKEPTIPSKLKTDGARRDSIEDDLENRAQAKIQRVPLTRSSERRLNRPIMTQPRMPTSTPQTDHPNYQMEPIKHSSSSNASLTSPPQISKPSPSNVSIDSEMDLWAGKTTRQRYEDNIQLQKCCAHYMYKFVERLQTQICDLNAPSEDELHVQLSGLKQIASILDGKLTFDDNSLQVLLDYKSKEKATEIINNGTDELS